MVPLMVVFPEVSAKNGKQFAAKRGGTDGCVSRGACAVQSTLRYGQADETTPHTHQHPRVSMPVYIVIVARRSNLHFILIISADGEWCAHPVGGAARWRQFKLLNVA